MEFIASTLKETLSKLNACVKSNPNLSLEDAKKICFSGTKVFVFTGEMFVESNLATDFCGKVDGASFTSFIDKMGTSSIDIYQEDDNLIVRKGKTIAKFLLEEPSEAVVPEDHEWKPIPEDFEEGIDTVSFTAGKDFTDLRTICLHVKGDIVESSDEERLTRFRMSSPLEGELFIPSDFAAIISRMKATKYDQDDDWIFFTNETDDLFCVRKIFLSEPYWDLGEIEESCNEGSLIEFPDQLYESLEAAIIFLSVKEADAKVSVVCKGGRIRVKSAGMKGQFSDVINSDIEEDFSFTINPSFLIQILEKSNKVYLHSDYIRLETEKYRFITTLPAAEDENEENERAQ